MDERAEPTGRAEAAGSGPSGAGGEAAAAGGAADRLDVLEHQVRQLTSRLAGWVEAQLVQALEDRRSDMKALRAELQGAVDEQLAGIRAESSSVLNVATRRLELAQEELNERLEAVAERAGNGRGPAGAELVEMVEPQLAQLREEIDAVRAELRKSVTDRPQRGAQIVPANEGLEQRVRSAMSRLSESVEAKLAEVTATRQGELDELRELAESAGRQAGVAAEVVHALRSDPATGAPALEALEHRVRSAVGRLSESVETRFADLSDTRRRDVEAVRAELQKALGTQLKEARTEVATSVSDAHRRFVDSVDRLDERLGRLDATMTSNGRRIEALEVHTRRTDDRLTDLVDAKLGEIVDRRVAELEERLAEQIREARTEIGTVVADAHRRFLDATERLDDRMAAVTGDGEAMRAAIAALEEHTRRTDARLTEIVDAKLSELATERIAELDEFRAQLRNALDAHLASTAADVAAAVGEGRQELAAGAAQLDRLEATLVGARERLHDSVEVKLAELDGVAAQLTKAQDEVAAVVASADRTATEARHELQAALTTLGAQVDAIAATTARAAFAEEGALAPVRSDVHLLQVRVDELSQLLAELRPRPKAPAAPSKAEERARALAFKRAAVGREAPAKRAARAVKTPAPAKKAGAVKKAGGAKKAARRPAAQ